MPNHDRFECQTAIDSDAILHTGAPPFHDVNVTQLIVIDYYYHAVIMLSRTGTR